MKTLPFFSFSVKSPYLFSSFNPKQYDLFPAAQGERHRQLAQFAGHLSYHGAEEHIIDQQLLQANQQYNYPPKEPAEIHRLAHFAATHWIPGQRPAGPSDFDIPNRALGWLTTHCFDPFFSGKGGCVTFAVLYACIVLSRKANSIDFNAACRDVALEAGVTHLTASRALRRLCHAGYLTRIGRRTMTHAQRYSLGGALCLHAPVSSWIEITSAMFRVSRAAAKFRLCYGNTWQTHLIHADAPDSVRVRGLHTKRQAAKRLLKRKGLDSLGKADDSEWRLKMMLQFQQERKAYADFVWRVRREKRFQRGKEGKLILRMAA